MISFEPNKKTALNLSISQKIIKHQLDKTKKKGGREKKKKEKEKREACSHDCTSMRIVIAKE